MPMPPPDVASTPGQNLPHLAASTPGSLQALGSSSPPLVTATRKMKSAAQFCCPLHSADSRLKYCREAMGRQRIWWGELTGNDCDGMSDILRKATTYGGGRPVQPLFVIE
jgi:hypothetical protein